MEKIPLLFNNIFIIFYYFIIFNILLRPKHLIGIAPFIIINFYFCITNNHDVSYVSCVSYWILTPHDSFRVIKSKHLLKMV